MPEADQRDLLVLKQRKGHKTLKGLLATVAETCDYDQNGEKTRSEDRQMASGGFPRFVFDTKRGLIPTITGAGGSRWFMREVNGLPRASLLTNLEMAECYCARGMAQEWLK